VVERSLRVAPVRTMLAQLVGREVAGTPAKPLGGGLAGMCLEI